MDDHSCLVRYGIMSHVGRFSTSRVRGTSLERGQLVVIQTDRGVELGEVLIVLEGQTDLVKDGPGDRNPTSTGQDEGSSLATSSRHVVRVASPADLASSRDAEDLRPSRFSLCQRILREGNWPWDLIDVEPLLDGSATVLHYLGPRQVEVCATTGAVSCRVRLRRDSRAARHRPRR